GFDAGYATLTAPTLLRDKLKGKAVLILTTPGAREAEVDSLIENLTTAGASVTGELTMTAKFLAPSNRQFVEGVASQSNPEVTETGYDSVGAAIARAYLTKADGAVDDTARTIRSAFAEGGLLEGAQEPET